MRNLVLPPRVMRKIPLVLMPEIRDTIEAWGVAIESKYGVLIITPKATLFRTVAAAGI